MQVNPLLQNLIEQYFGSLDEIPPNLSQFVQTVNNLFVSVSMDAGSPTQPQTQPSGTSFRDQVAESQSLIGQHISAELAGVTTQQEVFDILVAELQKSLNYLSTRIFGFPPGSGTLTLLSSEASADFPEQSPSSAGSIQTVADNLTTVITQAGTPENPTGVLYPEIAVPIHARGMVFGVLNVHVESNEALNNQTRFFLEMLASQVSLVLYNIRYREIDPSSGESPRVPEIPSATKWTSFKEISALKHQLYSYDPNLRTAVAHDGLAGPSTEHHPSRTMQVQGEIIGSLGISTEDGVPLTPAELALLDSISEEVSQALERAQLFESSKRSAAELAVLNEMGNLFSEAADEAAIVGGLYTYASQLIDAPQFFVAYYEAASDSISFPMVILDGQRVTADHPAANDFKSRPAGTGLTGQIIKTRQPILIENNAEKVFEELGLPFQQFGTQTESWLGVPMTMGDQVLGVISIQSDDEPGLYNNHHLELLSTIASQAAVAINNIRLFEQEQERAEQERLVRTITDRVRRGTDTRSIMRIALEELSQVLNAEVSSIKLGTTDQLIRSDNKNTAVLPPLPAKIPTTSELKLTDLDSFLEDFD